MSGTVGPQRQERKLAAFLQDKALNPGCTRKGLVGNRVYRVSGAVASRQGERNQAVIELLSTN